ncbi:MAG TPA: hypothetical protein PKX12_05645 [Spirochaetota bacterium]|nr:hypothetical protein [Spirochaetota bacterium]
MLIVFRFAAIVLFASAVVLQREYLYLFLPLSAVIIGAVYYFHGAPFLYVMKRNIFILSFSIVFAGFSFVSGYIDGIARLNDSVILAVKIVFVFNILLGGMRWIGGSGYLYLLNRVPGIRLRLFFLLLGNNLVRMARNNREIVRQIRSRMAVTGRNRLVLARYYFQNMLFRELYSMGHSHGAMVLRLGESLRCYEYPVRSSAADYILLFFITLHLAAGVVMQCAQ